MDWAYRVGAAAGRFTFLCTMRMAVIRPEAAERRGAYLIACSHLSHLEPFLLSPTIVRPIDWVTRIEFFRRRPIAWTLRALNAIPVRRFGVPVSTIRTSLARLARGRVVGICPEGGVTQGADSCLRGGAIKHGVCLLSYRSGAPVLPCVMLGTDKLNCVKPWLPFKRARVWLAFGERVIEPRRDLDRRTARRIMADELRQEYAKLYRELLQTYGIAEETVP